MSSFGNPAVSCLVCISLAGCADAVPQLKPTLPPAAGTNHESPIEHADLQSIIAAATQDAALQLRIAPETIDTVRAERVTWPDGSLGCPAPGMQYTQALVPGYRVMLRAGDRALDYHAAANGHLVLCPPGRAIEPAARDPI